MKIPGLTPKDIHIPPSAKRDVLLFTVLYLCNFFVFSAWPQLGQVATKPWLLLVWLCGLVGLLPLAWRNRAPVTVFTTQVVFILATWPIIQLYTPVVGIPVALYTVSVHCSKRISLVALLASFIANALCAFAASLAQPDPDQPAFIANVVFLTIMAAGAWGAGRLTQASRQHVQRLEQEQEVAQREREMAREAEALAAERRRIARELHDIVSHAVTVILLQAAGAARVANTDFAQVTQALAHIETTAKQTMTELRRLLGVLRAGDSGDHTRSIDELGPQPGLANLAELLIPLRTAGIPVTVHLEGTQRELDSSVDLTAYRIVQEGLTNVLKHAGKDANPQLRVIWQAKNLLIQIDNHTNLAEAPCRQTASVGHGLVGLRERAHAVGGHLYAGYHREGGYRLTATLPLATLAVTSPGVSSTTTVVPRASTQGRMD